MLLTIMMLNGAIAIELYVQCKMQCLCDASLVYYEAFMQQ